MKICKIILASSILAAIYIIATYNLLLSLLSSFIWLISLILLGV